MNEAREAVIVMSGRSEEFLVRNAFHESILSSELRNYARVAESGEAENGIRKFEPRTSLKQMHCRPRKSFGRCQQSIVNLIKDSTSNFVGARLKG
jgi:hypothetical protein